MINALRRLKNLLKGYPPLYGTITILWAIQSGLFGILTGRRGAKDHLLASFSLLRRSSYVSGRPMNITIEPTNVCNLRCEVCETGAGVLGRPTQNMTFDDFEVVINKIASHTNTLMFYFMGEPFLNKDAYRMIRYAKDSGIPFITTCTNGDFVDPEQLVDSMIDEVSFQVGGITQETHQVYRVGSSLNRVLDNLQGTVKLRNQKRPDLRIACGFILMKHNEHEVDEFKKRMVEIGVDDIIIVDPCVRTLEQARRLLPTDRSHWYYDSTALERNLLKPRELPANECRWLYYSLTIQVNGDVVPCCRDTMGEFVMGNLLTQNLCEIWNGPGFVQFRENIRKNQKRVSICRLCSGYDVSRIR